MMALVVATRYLKESETNLTDVAFLFGYSELSAFSNAFHRWTGTSPGSFRRSSRKRLLSLQV